MKKFSIFNKWLQLYKETRHGYRLKVWHAYPPLPLSESVAHLPHFVRACPVAMACRLWLLHYDWSTVRQKDKKANCCSQISYIAAFLVKIDQQLATLAALRRFLTQHPALVWGVGFPLVKDWQQPYGFCPEKSVPSRQQLARVLRQLPNEILQSLLTAQVKMIQTEMPATFGEVVSVDTKHILAWVKENNPRVYAPEKSQKDVQPKGDPDCKLGAKRSTNVRTPVKEGKPVTKNKKIGEFYWGYATGAVVTKVADKGEFVLAEMTQTFDKGDVNVFFPLMQATEQRLGFRPPFGTADAAFDAFYVYDHFHNPTRASGAMIPLNQPNKQRRTFADNGLPLCRAGLAMPIRKTYMDRTKAIVPHERAFYACPLRFPTQTAASCPVDHKQWPKGGCSVQIPTSIGARLRHQLDREGDQYKQIYKQRTAVERIFAQAKALGIERPKLRNQQAITNMNTLTYLLINARTYLRARPSAE